MPAHLQVHLIVDNYGTHKTPAIKAWLARHPRFELHFTPTGSSWINQVERWFGYLAHQMIRRGTHIAQHGLTLADALVEDLFLAPVPGEDGTAVVVHLKDAAPTQPSMAQRPAGAVVPVTAEPCGV